jgi:hypothetical protein
MYDGVTSFFEEMPMSETISISTIETALSHAEAELEKATASRVIAHSIENNWITEVTSLRHLLKARQSRSEAQPSVARIAPPAPNQPVARVTPVTDFKGDLILVDWMAKQVESSGIDGVTVPDIKRAAQAANIQMHPNYPYTALRSLVESKRIVKHGVRYLKAGIGAEFALAG